MTSDQEPRYRLVDANGNIVGSLYGKANGSIAIQETASGADREVALAPDGTFSAPSVETESVSTESLGITEDGLKSTQGIHDFESLDNEALDVTFDNLPSDVDTWVVKIKIQDEIPGDDRELHCRVNNLSTDEYDFVTIADTGMGLQEGQSSWTLLDQALHEVDMTFTLSNTAGGRQERGSIGLERPSAPRIPESFPMLFSGAFNTGSPLPLDRIDIYGEDAGDPTQYNGIVALLAERDEL